MRKTLRERFEEKYTCEPNTGCWLWTAGVNPVSGYGMIGSGTRPPTMLYAHRVSFELLVGPIPDGLDIDHRCHVRSCVNPSHLRPATRRENLSNRKDKGSCSSSFVGVYHRRGSRNWEAMIWLDGHRAYLGSFTTEREAGDAYLRALICASEAEPPRTYFR